VLAAITRAVAEFLTLVNKLLARQEKAELRNDGRKDQRLDQLEAGEKVEADARKAAIQVQRMSDAEVDQALDPVYRD
jgi:ribosome assembly protein YihI (activator of Der GTPase)